MARVWICVAALLGASAVGMGAYHAHGLKTYLEGQGLDGQQLVRRMNDCQTAVRYQMYHALALLAVGLLALRRSNRLLSDAAVFFLLGIAGFSGGLYVIVFTGRMLHWAIVPAGGLLLIIAWIVLAAAALAAGRAAQ